VVGEPVATDSFVARHGRRVLPQRAITLKSQSQKPIPSQSKSEGFQNSELHEYVQYPFSEHKF
jgi:hypothetical protein